MKKIYIMGEARGAYRTQAFVKMVLDHPDEFRLKYNSWFQGSKGMRFIKSFFLNPFSILFADIVYVPALNVGLDILHEVLWAHLMRKQIIVEYYVSVYDTVILDRKMFSETSVLAKLAMKYDQLMVTAASKVIFLNLCEYNRYKEISNLTITDKKLRIIPLCIERRGERTNQNRRMGDTFTMCWWGSYLPLHGLGKLIDAVKLLEEAGEDVQFYIFGNDSAKAKKYIEHVKQINLSDRIFFNHEYSFSNGLLEPFLLANCQLSFGIFGDSGKARNVIANKILDAVVLKSPILTGPSNALSDYFDGRNDLFYCEATPEAIAGKVRKIIAMDTTDLDKRVEKAYEIFEENFTVEKYKDKMMELLQEL